MGATKRPETLRAEELLRENPKPSEVRRLLANEGIEMSLHRLRNIKGEIGAPLVNVDASEFIPWPLRGAHQNLSVAQRLRDLARIMRNPPLEIGERRYMLLKNFLADLKSEDLVIDYDPVKGFVRVPRRYASNRLGFEEPVDRGWIKEPTLNDDGSKKENWIPPEK